jgi:integrase
MTNMTSAADKESLTDRFCDLAQGPSDGRRDYLIYYDPEVKGFGLRVTRNGAKSFILNYRADGIERRYTIGTFRDPWRVAGARKEALRLKALIDQGKDPQGEKQKARTAPTVGDLIERWRKEHAPKLRPRNRQQNELLISQWIKPELGPRRVADLRYADIEALHRKISTKGGKKRTGTPYRANRTLALLSKMMSLAVKWEWRSDNPCRGVERNDEEKRSRHLKPDELEKLVAALAEHPDQTAANAVRLLLLTGARSGEVVDALWDQFDLGAGIWAKPSSHTKQKREHRVPLSAPARQLLAEMKQTDFRIFPNLDQPRLRARWAEICRMAEIKGARIHDLRHSYASFLVSAGLSLPVIGALLGHTQPSTTARYTHLFDDPLRAATEQVGAIFSAAETAPKGQVVDLPRKEGRA